MINDSGKFWYVSPTGQAIDDNPPSGSTVLVAPGGTIDDALAERYGVADKLKAPGGKAPVRRDGAGNPVVVRGGRAVAADLLGGEEARAVMDRAREEDDAKVLRAGEPAVRPDDEPDAEDEPADEPGLKVKASGKAVRMGQADVEDKSVAGPRDAKSARKK